MSEAYSLNIQLTWPAAIGRHNNVEMIRHVVDGGGRIMALHCLFLKIRTGIDHVNEIKDETSIRLSFYWELKPGLSWSPAYYHWARPPPLILTSLYNKILFRKNYIVTEIFQYQLVVILVRRADTYKKAIVLWIINSMSHIEILWLEF